MVLKGMLIKVKTESVRQKPRYIYKEMIAMFFGKTYVD